MKVHAFAARG